MALLFVVATSHVITNKTILKGRMHVTQEDLDGMRHSIFFEGRSQKVRDTKKVIKKLSHSM